MSNNPQNKSLIKAFHAALEAADSSSVESVLQNYMADDYTFYGVYPFNEITGVQAVADQVWRPLMSSLHRMQRREDVFMGGVSEIAGDEWVMSMGHFMGLFDGDWLGIRATKKMVMLRYAEFNSVVDGKIAKTGFFVDIIGLMHQLGINPLPPQTGASFTYPGPRDHSGIQLGEHPEEEGEKTLAVLNKMIDDLSALNAAGNGCPPEVLAKTWHDDMIWYGPAGIGASYTIERYQAQHQRPFRENLKDKVFNGHISRFAEGNYACFFGWPNLSNTPTGGFLGLPGGEVRADMRVVDVYRREGDKLLENWVLIDIPYWLKQQGVDILERTASILNPS